MLSIQNDLDVVLKKYPSGSMLRLHPIIDHVEQQWKNAGKDISKFDLHAISLRDVAELCRAQGDAYQLGDLKLHYWKIDESFRWWLPPLQQSVPIVDTNQSKYKMCPCVHLISLMASSRHIHCTCIVINFHSQYFHLHCLCPIDCSFHCLGPLLCFFHCQCPGTRDCCGSGIRGWRGYGGGWW